MKLTIVGSGDAFSSGSRANTCFLLQTGKIRVAIDFGATSLLQMKRLGLDPKSIDVIVLSHLHGDHFGAIPSLLLYRQFDCERLRPLRIVGPVGTCARLKAAQEVLFPGTSAIDWKFNLTVEELPCGQDWSHAGLGLISHEVVHPSGAPATGVRLQVGKKLFAYSGDTQWTEALLAVAQGADLFICECHKPAGAPVYHMSLETLMAQRERLGAKRIMLTHMSDEMLARIEKARAQGFEIAEDGLVVEI